MTHQAFITRKKSKLQAVNWGRSSLNLLLVLALGLALGASALPAPMLRAQPALRQIAAQQPDAVVQVIVQKAVQDTSLERLVGRLGGKVTGDLRLINAFAAEMTAGAAQELAASPAVRWISLDAAVNSTACPQCVDTARLVNGYVRAIRAEEVWNNAPYRQGQGIGVAVVDSGVNPNGDLYTSMGVNRQVANVRYNTDYNQSYFDGYGHGTHVASIVGGDGSESNGQYIGVAPMVNIVNVKVSNDNGSSTIKDVVLGLQWILDNKSQHNIRVVNLSLNSSAPESYHTSPLSAAVEILWFNKIVVVASAGNQGSGAIYPPANDPFVITAGATDDNGTAALADDAVASFSAYGLTSDGHAKPDLVAPGANITARLVNLNMGLAAAHPSNKVGNQYFRMSGTSMAAPMVSGAIALLLQDEPDLTPDQVKYRLMATANKAWPGYSATQAGAGYLDIYAAVNGATTESANTNLAASQLLWTGSQPVTWSSVNWNSVNWNSVNWNSVNWNSDYWGP